MKSCGDIVNYYSLSLDNIKDIFITDLDNFILPSHYMLEQNKQYVLYILYYIPILPKIEKYEMVETDETDDTNETDDEYYTHSNINDLIELY